MKRGNSQSPPDEYSLRRAVEAIRRGGVVGIPTETYYGLAVDPANEQAVAELFRLKQRPVDKPVLLLISQLEQLHPLVAAVPEAYRPLIESYWPGPLTLVFPAAPTISPLLTAGTATIGIRQTPHPQARRIIEMLGGAITATSANISSEQPALSAHQVRRIFGEKLAWVVDGGEAGQGPGSTVVNHIDGRVCLERRGRITLPGDLPDCVALRSRSGPSGYDL